MYETWNKPVHGGEPPSEVAQQELAGLELLPGRDVLFHTQTVLDCLVPAPLVLQVLLFRLPPEKPFTP